MRAHAYALFDTPIGCCGLAWSAAGITGMHLPGATRDATRASLKRRFPAARETPPPAEVQRAIDGIQALLQGGHDALRDVVLDMDDIPEFHRRVYELSRWIDPGATLTYGEVADRLGEPGAARAVGQALGRNPFAIIVPCHRVLAAGGRPGGFSAPGGVSTKARLLEIEGAFSAPSGGQGALF